MMFITPVENTMERDKFMNPMEAREFGLIDVVVEHPPLAAATSSTETTPDPASPSSSQSSS